jgi:hypothetical protein
VAARPFLIYGTPRSGTSLYTSILRAYLTARRGVTYLGEYLNPSHEIWQAGGRIGWTEGSPDGWTRYSREERRAMADQRLALIQSDPARYFFKVLNSHVDLPRLKRLGEIYEFIFVEREDLFEQLLSFLISKNTGQWYERGGIHVGAGSIPLQRQHVLRFERAFLEYQRAKAELRPRYVLKYEDFLRDPEPGKVLARLGIRESLEGLIWGLPEKQNPGDKRRFFKNSAEVEDAYRPTFMNSISRRV